MNLVYKLWILENSIAVKKNLDKISELEEVKKKALEKKARKALRE